MRMHDDAGKQVKGTVTRITDFGAVVRLQDGRTGLVHISQVADVYVADVHDFLTVGQEVQPIVLSTDEKGRLALSLKTGKRQDALQKQPALFSAPPKPNGFEDMLSRYKSASEDKLGGMQKNKVMGKRKNRS